ncbi:hypothetical protein [Priestia filamentosa]|uniref:Uncharacterized protein n=1 Tax=Priestia filamentosa TaxID=1402861 RepID=A0A1X7ERF9_9BACI|nr:hypothetical protein [Priestia filamentosa]AKO93251.1 hypothetical protein BEH_14910 [Priestia filamentosa]MDT3763399.1 hypothetical protein [Priestia filamentosa]OXS69953.1 hypothetical protein B1B01_13480 [Priestia filamentosa]WRU93844.1 hypothetical protein RYX51_12450 [Priestia filamentosa]SMF38492.1 hypothetical protein SAMN06296056_1021279 [Priestia filamentosa]
MILKKPYISLCFIFVFSLFIFSHHAIPHHSGDHSSTAVVDETHIHSLKDVSKDDKKAVLWSTVAVTLLLTFLWLSQAVKNPSIHKDRHFLLSVFYQSSYFDKTSFASEK